MREKEKTNTPVAEEQSEPVKQGKFLRNLPVIVLAVMVLWLLGKAFSVPSKPFRGMDMHGFGRLQVVESGRVKPLDSLARNYLILISERQTTTEMVPDSRGREKEVKRPAIKWLLDTMSGSPTAANYRVFRIENLHVLRTLGLKPRHGYRYTLKELVPRLPELVGETLKANEKRRNNQPLSLEEEQFVELGMRLQHVVHFYALIAPHIIPPEGDNNWRSITEWVAGDLGKRQPTEQETEAMARQLRQAALPTIGRGDFSGEFRQSQKQKLENLRDIGNEPIRNWADMLLAWQRNDANAFNNSLAEAQKRTAEADASGSSGTGFEVFYNHLEPFSTSAAMYLMGFLLICVSWLFGAPVDEERMKSTGRLIFGIVCFALLLSFVGTVLGGLWADDSWGRFWGWDPKENGALMIVLWNAIILHARLGGFLKARGLAILALGGNIITAWSWFGVNQLGVGLHSYGAVSGITFWLLVFCTSQLLFIIVGSLPHRFWMTSTDTGKSGTVALSSVLNRAAFNLIAFTFVLHTFGLIARIWISGYPPVTTLYSSAIFIGWGAVIMGLLLEKMQRSQPGIGNAMAAVGGFSTLLIAHFLAIGDGDTFTMMQAVLDTRFWLATHVTTVTLGYMATFVAGGLGMYMLFRSNRWCVFGLGIFFDLWYIGGLVARKKGIEFPPLSVGENLLVNPLYIFLWAGIILTTIGGYRMSQSGWLPAPAEGRQ